MRVVTKDVITSYINILLFNFFLLCFLHSYECFYISFTNALLFFLRTSFTNACEGAII